MKKLSEIASIFSGNAWKASSFKPNGKLPIIRIQNIGSNKSSEFVYWDEDYKDSFIVQKGEILLSLSGSIKLDIWNGPTALLNQRIVRITPNEDINSEWLYYQLTKYVRKIELMGKNAIVNNVSLPDLKNLTLNVPPLPDQLHIANILSKAENLIAQRKESIRLLDEFLKSTFLEMFGDPVRNEKGWEINSLSKFGSLKNGLNYTRSESGVEVRCLGVGDFKELSKLTDMDSLQILSLTFEPNIEYFLKDGDLVFVRSNGNRELVGRCILVFPKSAKVTFSGFCIRYRIEKNGLNPIFISHLFRVPIFRTLMLQGGKGANIQNISQQTLEKLKIPVPPIELQTQFACVVEKTETLKFQYQQSLQELENLYGSLSQKAFRGELGVKQLVKA